MVTHNFLPKWFPWQTKSCDILTLLLLTRILNMVKIGLKLLKLQSEVALFRNISLILSVFTLKGAWTYFGLQTIFLYILSNAHLWIYCPSILNLSTFLNSLSIFVGHKSGMWMGISLLVCGSMIGRPYSKSKYMYAMQCVCFVAFWIYLLDMLWWKDLLHKYFLPETHIVSYIVNVTLIIDKNVCKRIICDGLIWLMSREDGLLYIYKCLHSSTVGDWLWHQYSRHLTCCEMCPIH